MDTRLNSPSPEQIVFLIPDALVATADFGRLDPAYPSLFDCSTGDTTKSRESRRAWAFYAPERQRGDHMEKCVYCERPLAETERVRWYSEHVHSECYEALLADDAAIIVTEQLAQDHRKEMMPGGSKAGALPHS